MAVAVTGNCFVRACIAACIGGVDRQLLGRSARPERVLASFRGPAAMGVLPDGNLVCDRSPGGRRAHLTWKSTSNFGGG